MFQLGNSGKYVCVNEFEGKVLIHVRKYFEEDGDRLIPTKKGIALNLSEWGVLKRSIQLIERDIEKKTMELQPVNHRPAYKRAREEYEYDEKEYI